MYARSARLGQARCGRSGSLSAMVRVRVEQEDPSSWPAFERAELEAAGLVSVVARREVDETVNAAAAAALELMAGAVLDTMGAPTRAVVYASRTHWPVNRVGQAGARRDRLWGALERDGLVVPRGVRSESEVPPSGDGGLTFVGWLEADVVDVPALGALTRAVPAVCLVGTTETDVPAERWDALLDARESTNSLFVAAEAHRDVLGHSFALRCHGAFDDAEASCDAVGDASAIARLTAALHERLGS